MGTGNEAGVGLATVTDEDLTPAATVLLLRDGDPGLEVLMLRRNSKIAFGGMWVFPGGAVDDHEYISGDSLESARVAAVREVEEETALIVVGNELETWSYWVPPRRAAMPGGVKVRRFSTWFFVTTAPDGDIEIDGGEIHEHQWLTPDEAMAKRHAGEIELVPPTWVTLHQLSRYTTVEGALSWARANEPGEFRTRSIGKDPLTLAWAGDHLYDAARPEGAGPEGARHRLTMHPDGWVYERSS